MAERNKRHTNEASGTPVADNQNSLTAGPARTAVFQSQLIRWEPQHYK